MKRLMVSFASMGVGKVVFVRKLDGLNSNPAAILGVGVLYSVEDALL